MIEDEAGYVVVDTWRVKRGKEAELASALAGIRQRFLIVPGIRSVDFAQIDGDTSRYLVIFRYRDAAAREAFVSTDDLKATMARLSQLWDFDGIALHGVNLPPTE